MIRTIPIGASLLALALGACSNTPEIADPPATERDPVPVTEVVGDESAQSELVIDDETQNCKRKRRTGTRIRRSDCDYWGHHSVREARRMDPALLSGMYTGSAGTLGSSN